MLFPSSSSFATNYCSGLPTFWFLFSAPTLLLFLWITSVQSQEMSRRRTGNVCRDDTECPKFAFCELVHGQYANANGQCVCNQGFIIMSDNGRRECHKEAATIGDECKFNEQCMKTLSTESECRYGRCQCRNGTHFVQKENTCYKSVRIGDFCRFSNNCIGEGTVCRSGVCHCPVETHPSFDMIDCIRDTQLGDKCSYDEECVAENTRCHDICRCKVSHVINKDGDKCVKVANHLFQSCDEDRQCTERIPHTKCDQNNRTCTCKDNYHELKYKCWVSVRLGGICEVDENCALIQNAICLEGRCICRDGLHPLNGICSSSSIRITMSQRILALIIFIYLFLTKY